MERPNTRFVEVVSAIGEHVTATDDAHRPTPVGHEEPWVGIDDDDQALRLALARALRGNGIRAETFGSAEEFLDRAIVGEPACMVVDIHLGGMSGFELQACLASTAAAPPIIFITAHDMLSQRPEASAAFGYLRKPFDTSALVALLRPHLSPPAPPSPSK